MIAKLLGIIDIITALAFFINNSFDKANIWFPNIIVLSLGIYLLVKGIIFLIFMDIASLLDVISGIIILVSLNLIIYPLLVLIVVFFLLQKGIFSLISS